MEKGQQIGTVWGWLDTTYIINLPSGDYYFNVASVNNNGNYNFSVSMGDLVTTSIKTYNNHIFL